MAKPSPKVRRILRSPHRALRRAPSSLRTTRPKRAGVEILEIDGVEMHGPILSTATRLELRSQLPALAFQSLSREMLGCAPWGAKPKSSSMARLEVHQYPDAQRQLRRAAARPRDRGDRGDRCARRRGAAGGAAREGLGADPYPHHPSSSRPHRRQHHRQAHDRLHHRRPRQGGGLDPRHRHGGQGRRHGRDRQRQGRG